jgi:hypothetical protein
VDTRTLVTLLVTVLLAFAGYLATYFNGHRLARRKDRLDRVSRQLSDFYGPLLALSRAGARSWDEFMESYRPDANYFWDEDDPPTEEQAELYRIWMRSVFMPLNVRMFDVVTNKADLLDESEVPECLLQLCAHVASYQAILKRWENEDFSEHAAVINFPRLEIEEYAETTFTRLKAEQNRLLGVNQPG